MARFKIEVRGDTAWFHWRWQPTAQDAINKAREDWQYKRHWRIVRSSDGVVIAQTKAA